MKIKSKILIILSIIVASLFICAIDSYANFVVDDVTLPDVPSDTYSDYALFYDGSYYVLVKYNYGEYFLKYSSSRLYICNSSGSSQNYLEVAKAYRYKTTGWTLLNGADRYYYSANPVCYTNQDIYSDVASKTVAISANIGITLETPTIMNSSTSWDTGLYDYIVVYSNDFIGENWQDFYLLAYDYSTETEESLAIYPKKVIPIENGTSSPYYTSTSEDYGYVFYVPTSSLGLTFKNSNNYAIKLAFKESTDGVSSYNYFYTYSFTVANLTEEEIAQNKQDVTNSLLEEQQGMLKEQNTALKEQNETSKSIWGTIKEILSYLNPFSENFFAYKLVELILDGLKSLFIPSDDFFETFFTEMKDWFSDRLGFLFYPFELVIDILNKILNVNFSEPVFNIPDIKEPFTNTKLIGATTYNLNSLLSNSVLENIHNIYLVVVDAIIIFALVNLAKRKFEEVTSK